MMDAAFLNEEREVPSGQSQSRIVAWSIFRSKEDASRFLEHVHLATGQQLVGGHSQDSVARYWWVGVQVNDLEHWGHSAAINKRGRLGD